MPKSAPQCVSVLVRARESRMANSKLATLLRNELESNGYQIEIRPDHKDFICVESPSKYADIMPYTFILCRGATVLVMGMVDLAMARNKYACDDADVAYALTQVSFLVGQTGIRVEIKDGEIILHSTLKAGFLQNLFSPVYNRVYDVMVAIHGGVQEMNDELSRLVRNKSA